MYNTCMKRHFLLFFVLFLISIVFTIYANSFCLSGDDIWIMIQSANDLFAADHGSLLPVKILTFLNFQLPIFLNINPQIMLAKYNIFLYGIFYTCIIYLLTNAAFIFNKDKLYRPLYLIINAVLIFSFSMLISANQYFYWMKESCTYLRFTFSIITLLLLVSFAIQNILLKKINIISKKNIILIFFYSLLAANTSEYNCFVCFIFGCLFIADLLFSKGIKNNKKLLKFSLTSLFGIITGAILIILNPAFREITYESGRVGLYFPGKSLSVFLPVYASEMLMINLIYMLIAVVFILILKKMYIRPLYSLFTKISVLLFISVNLFYPFLYLFTKSLGELSHGDLKLLVVCSLVFNLWLLFGLILKKIKNIKVKAIINIIILICWSLIIGIKYNVIINEVVKIRRTNFKERAYLSYLEHNLSEQYINKNTREIRLKIDKSIPLDYRETYVYNYIPIINKKIIMDTYKVEWITEEE